VLVVIGLLVAIVALLLVLFARRRRVRAEQDDAEAAGAAESDGPATTVDFTKTSLGRRVVSTFRGGLRQLRRHLGLRNARYRLPWSLLLAERSTHAGDLLGRSGLDLPLGEPESAAEGGGLAWWFLNQGVVLQVEADCDHRDEGGRGADERVWRLLLRLLARHRPERPLDSVILAVPVADLVGDEARRDEAASRATALGERLRRAQRRLGMTFPVYVLVTGCERLPGFAGFFQEVPEALHGGLFGWSNPYSLETEWRADWLDEAFEALAGGLHRAQFQVYGERVQIDRPDEVFAFPGELAPLREPLRAALAQIFRPSAYHEPLYFRGVYFCGALPADSASESAGRVLFVRDVLERRVFGERGLARPLAAALSRGTRTVRVAQAALLVCGLMLGAGVWWGNSRLERSRQILHPVLEEIARDLDILKAKEAAGVEPEEAFLWSKAESLFQGMARLDTNRFSSIFLPSSWFSRFNRDLELSFTRAFREVVFKAMSIELGHHARELILDRRPAAPVLLEERGVLQALDDSLQAIEDAAIDPADGQSPEQDVFLARFDDERILPVEETPELKGLAEYVRGLVELQTNVERFNQIATTSSTDLDQLGALAEYLFGESLPDRFFESSGLYRESLRYVRYPAFKPEDWRREAETTALRHADLLFDRLYRRNPLVFRLERLAEDLERLAERQGAVESRRLREIHQLIGEVDRTLQQPDLAWMSRAGFDLGKPFDETLAAVAGSPFLGPEVAESIRRRGRAENENLAVRLSGLSSRFTGALLARDGQGRWNLSPNGKVLDAAFADLLAQNFMNVDRIRSLRVPLRPGDRIVWEPRGLEQAAALYDPYRSFLEKGLPLFPQNLQPSLSAVALNRLGANMTERILQAHRLEAAAPAGRNPLLLEREIQAEVDNLRASGKPLADLVQLFDRLGLRTSRDELSDLVAEQAGAILTAVDLLLEAEAPYVPREGGFAWWDGRRPANLPAFGTGDAAELASYLSSERERIAEIAREYADPALRALGSGAHSREIRRLAVKWEGILAELHKHESQKPGNAVAALETTILAELAEVESSNCFEAITPRMLSEPDANFFLAARNRLRRRVYDRCEALAMDRALAGYRRVAAYFNQRLAGRFPFSEGIPERGEREADPDDLRAFFELYDRDAPLLASLPANERRLGAGEVEIRAFLDRLAQVRALFAPFLDDPAAEAPAFDLEVDFRVNRKFEVAGNQVLRWEMVVGSRPITPFDAERAGRWQAGQPVSLLLQWAKDAPVAPVSAGPRSQVRETDVSFRYGGRWALFALLREHAASTADFGGFADPRPRTLRFDVTTRPLPPATEEPPLVPPKPSRATVFVRVTLLTPDRKIDVKLPDFPVRAPSLDRFGLDDEEGAVARTR
jgi:type VI secretion system protein ImpL